MEDLRPVVLFDNSQGFLPLEEFLDGIDDLDYEVVSELEEIFSEFTITPYPEPCNQLLRLREFCQKLADDFNKNVIVYMDDGESLNKLCRWPNIKHFGEFKPKKK